MSKYLESTQDFTFSNLEKSHYSGHPYVAANVAQGEVMFNNHRIPDNEIWYKGNNAWWNADDMSPAIVESIYDEASQEGKIIFENSNIILGSTIMTGQNKLDGLALPASTQWSGTQAFWNQASLSCLILTEGIKAVGEMAFHNGSSTSSLKQVYLPESLETLGISAFYGMGLESIFIPKNCISIGRLCFANCGQLETINVHEENPVYDSRDNCNAIIETKTNKLIAVSINTKIPDSVTALDDGCFRGSGITAVDIPSSITSLSDYMFHNCTKLQKVTFMGVIDTIPMLSFDGCSKLKEINLPEGLQSIEANAFRSCKELKSITIPSSVNKINSAAFSSCYFLPSNVINNSQLDAEANNYWGATVLSSEVDGICIKGTRVLYCRSGFNKDVVIPEGVTELATKLFYRKSPTSIILPSTLTKIGSQAFQRASALTRMDFSGTIAQWNKISKGSNWKSGMGTKIVHCTDGDVNL